MVSERASVTISNEVPVTVQSDVLVAGGGPAGFAAAVSAARAGAEVLVVEQHGSLGGNCTNALVTSWNNLERPGAPEIDGVYQELIDRLTRIGGIAGSRDGVRQCFFDPEALKCVMDEIAAEAGVQVLFHTFIAEAIVVGSSVTGIVIQNKSGRQAALGRIVVDTTGDADVACSAGVPCVKGRDKDGLMQPATLKLRFGNVDTDRLEAYLAEHPKEVFVQAHLKDTYDGTIAEAPRMSFGRLEGEFKGRVYIGFPGILATAKADGVTIFTDYVHFHSTSRPGEMMINMARVRAVDGTDAWSVSKGETEGRRQAVQLVAFFRKYVPGFEACYLMQSAPHIGIRETRRIVGQHVLSPEECEKGVLFPDTVATAYSTMLDVHSPTDKGFSILRPLPHPVHIPYRSLVPLERDGLLVAGRCISASHVAIGSVRSTHKCMASGHAAGVAAALCIKRNVQPRLLPADLVQSELRRQGVNFG